MGGEQVGGVPRRMCRATSIACVPQDQAPRSPSLWRDRGPGSGRNLGRMGGGRLRAVWMVARDECRWASQVWMGYLRVWSGKSGSEMVQ